MGTGICLFWTGKTGFTALGLGFNHLGNGMGNLKNGNGVSLLQWSPNSLNFSRHIESVIFIAAKFVLPDQWISQSTL